MNTSETLPDGVWFRKDPHTADAIRLAGFGVYKNEQVQLQCYAWGDAVGPYSNRLWYYANNVTRPTVAGQANVGYLNAHYINDGKNANQVDAGVPECGAAPTPPVPLPLPKSVYFSGTGDATGGTGQQVADVEYASNVLIPPPTCSLSSSVTIPSGTATLAGWSGGRLGVIYSLKRMTQAQYGSIHELIFIDPGNSSDFVPCDARMNVNQLLADWLRSNSNNHLLVLTGLRSEEKKVLGVPTHRFGASTFAGLWKYYFAGIWNQPFANRAQVCDYNSADHAQIMKDSWGIVKFPPDGCPVLSHESAPVAWNP